MPEIPNVVLDETITPAWGNAVADAINDHTHDGTAGTPGATPVDHDDLTGVSANDHHPQAHALSGADHTGTLPIANLANIANRRALGNVSGGAGAVAELTPDQLIGLLWDATISKAANEDVTNSAALQDDDHLSFATVAATNYEFEAYLFYQLQSGTAADLKVALGEDAVFRGVVTLQGISAADAAVQAVVATDNSVTTSWSGTTANRAVVARGVHRGNGGTFRLRWAQNTATAGVYTRILAGSFLRYRALPA